ncbi:hypothetical protein M3N55_15490 [Roseibaca sp. V10]|uniref:Uncharacterized protein n=1 Tax=Roseinatronobacter domitianus TaxID=2940293 RepID=A0ABT0M5J4_9RHOB|nr:hypothetical protein [Roseibaca domitiana]MCL1630127.1 hypothetical protein [Roseibaca domitiana]
MTFVRHSNTFPGSWEKIVDKFAELNGRYVDHAWDAAYWYSEMTNTGLLATAAWMSDVPAICEVRENKRVFTGRQGRPGPSLGRVDLFFYHDGVQGDWVETKSFTSPRDMSEAQRERRVIRGLSAKMTEARNAARQCKNVARNADPRGRVVALVFVPFVLCSEYYGQGRRSPRREERAAEAIRLLAEYAENNDCSYAAYFNTAHIDIWDENDMRPFGFGIVACFDQQ